MNETSEFQKGLLDALFRAFLPLAGLLLQAGLTYREFELVARDAFVFTASRSFGVRGRETNTSRVAHMTGLTRKEVRRIRSKFDDEEDHITHWKDVQRPGDVLHGWYSDPEFLTPDGTPRRLSPRNGFDRLVKKHAGSDIPVGVIKKELKRVNAIIEHDDGSLEPLKRHCVPVEAVDRLRTSVNFGLFGLLSTIRHNSDPDRTEPGRLERFVSSGRIPLSRVEEVRSELRREGERFSLHIDDLLSKYEETEFEEDSTTCLNVGMGIFYYEEDLST